MTKSEPSEKTKLAAERAVAALLELVASVQESRCPAAPAPSLEPSPFTARRTRELVRAGRLRAEKIGRRWYARPDDIAALVPPAPPAPSRDTEEDGAERVLQEVLGPKGLRLGKRGRR